MSLVVNRMSSVPVSKKLYRAATEVVRSALTDTVFFEWK